MNSYSVYIHTVPNGKRYIGMTSKEPHITCVCTGKRKTTGGFAWEYAEGVV